METDPSETLLVNEPEPEAEPAREAEPEAEAESEAESEAKAEPEPTAEVEQAPEPVAPLKLGPGAKKSDEELFTEACTLLFASAEPLTDPRLTVLLERPEADRVAGALEAIQAQLEASPLPVVLRKIAGGWRLMTDPALGEVTARLRKEPKTERISAAALETLAIVAYRQPVTKAEVEAIRGVQAGPVLRALVDRNLIRVTGRADLPGSPLQYGTTKEFLERFGLAGLKELPRDGELAEG